MSTPCLAEPTGRIQTRFGAFTVPEPQVVTFPDGLPGFESCRRFVLILVDELRPFCCLHGLDDPYPSFLAVDPAMIDGDYRPALGPADVIALDRPDRAPLWLVLVTLGPDESTANLAAPIAINPAAMKGRQVLLDGPAHSVRRPLLVR